METTRYAQYSPRPTGFCYTGNMSRAELARLIDKLVPLIEREGECFLWRGGTNNIGYAKVWWEKKHWLVHRLVYERFVAPISKGLEIDHLCHNRACIRVDHLEAVTHQENQRRAAALGRLGAGRVVTLCSAVGCERPPRVGGKCLTHTERTHLTLTPTMCSADECASPMRAQGLCAKHYYQASRAA